MTNLCKSVFSCLSEEERERRRQHQLCFYCGESGHRSLGCPHKSQASPRVNLEYFSLLSNKSLTLPIILRTDTLSLELTAMIDSGAALNLINKDIVTKFNIPTQLCTPPIRIRAIDDSPIGKGITHQTTTLTLNVGFLHQESISLYIVDSPKHEIILGHPWLSIHDPDISWHHGELTHWSTFCLTHCFPTKPQPCLTTSIESPNIHKIVIIPSCYNEFSEVFSKTKATQLPPPIDAGTVLLTFFPMPCLPKAKFTLSPEPKLKLWKNTSQRL